MYAAHGKRQRVVRTTQPQELHRDDGNDEDGVEQIDDDAMPGDGVLGARPEKGRSLFGEMTGVHAFRFHFFYNGCKDTFLLALFQAFIKRF